MFETVLHRESQAASNAGAVEPLPVHHPALPQELFGDVLRDGRHPSAPVLTLVKVHAHPPGFEGVRRRDLGARSGRRIAWVGASTVFQALVVAGIAVLAANAAQRRPEPLAVVPVRIAAPAKAAIPPPPPPPPAAPAMVKRTRPLPPDAKVVAPPPPSALVQPREVAEQMKPPDPAEPYEALPEGTEGGEGAGVVGGAVTAPPPPPPATNEIEEAPRWMTTGFRAPAEVERGCVARSVRLPRELAGFVSGSLTVKFAVLSTGQVDRIEVLGNVLDGRIRDAIANAVHSCRFTPGADATGRPTAIWVVLPLRFQAG